MGNGEFNQWLVEFNPGEGNFYIGIGGNGIISFFIYYKITCWWIKNTWV